MNNFYSVIRYDKEFEHAKITLGEQYKASKPLPIIINGLSGGMLDAFLHEMILTVSKKAKVPSLVIVQDEHAARNYTDSLSLFGIRAKCFPKRELVFHNISASHDTERERLFVLYSLISGECDCIVTTLPAALTFTMPRELLSQSTLEIKIGDIFDIADLALKLSLMGYTEVEAVDGCGQFSRRGGILDIFPKSAENPIRIEFFDNEIDRMGYFDIITQRLFETCDDMLLLPAKEIIIDGYAKERIISAIGECLKKCKNPEGEKELSQELALARNTSEILFADKYLSCIYPEPATLFDYLSDNRCPTFIVELNGVKESYKSYTDGLNSAVEAMKERGSIISKYAEYAEEYLDFEMFLSENIPVHVNSFSSGLGSVRCADMFGFRGRRTVSYADKYQTLVEDIRNFKRTSYKTLILCEGESEAKSLSESLEEDGISVIPAYSSKEFNPLKMIDGCVYISVGRISSGFELVNAKAALLSMKKDSQGVSANRRIPKKKHAKNSGERIMSYADLHEGDFVVHANHGIGRYDGLTTLKIDGVTKDYITIAYAGTDKLFLPADRLEMISRYIGAHSDDGCVKLSKLGGNEWHRQTAKAKASAKNMAKDLIRLYAERMQRKGFAFPEDSDIERDFDNSFEFEETEPQLAAISEIKADMQKPVPMDRLLCGDVGFGKTEVALRAAFKAIAAGKQTAILVPTTILALQHYQTAMSRMRGYPVNIEMLSRFRTARQSSEIIRRLKRGDIDLIIGTHKLLGKDVEFKSLGLLIVDEEQRFGVAQKEKIKQKAALVDVLTLTATPIPRTLNMAMSGIRDMSILDEAPSDRLPVQTYVLEYDDVIIEDAIAKELARKGQVLYLYNKVETIERVYAKIAGKFPEARVAYAHGQMEHDELEDIWQSLVRCDTDILICTTIIETGVDLPNANTLIIENSDRMGLSQLHQIRGRIGRSGRQAYAYFTYRAGKALSEIATKRLTAIREYAEFGAGFKIALRDLEIRGAGNLLGTEQHGNIDAVGYDLYIKLLNEAILEEKGETPKPPFESTVCFNADAHIPDYYIRSSSQRIEMYKKISLITDADDRKDVFNEFCDRFGDMPKAAERLLDIALVRALASKYRMSKVELVSGELKFHSEKFNLDAWSELFMSFTGLRMYSSNNRVMLYKLKKGQDAVKTAAEIMTAYDKAEKSTEDCKK